MSIEIGDPVVFPSVIGLEFEDAEKVAYAAGVVLADFDPDAPPPLARQCGLSLTSSRHKSRGPELRAGLGAHSAFESSA